VLCLQTVTNRCVISTTAGAHRLFHLLQLLLLWGGVYQAHHHRLQRPLHLPAVGALGQEVC
jgi:hypothetical protein